MVTVMESQVRPLDPFVNKGRLLLTHMRPSHPAWRPRFDVGIDTTLPRAASTL
ncbi:hypothetical protein T07_8040 [Trichinella nelsoni]|uniref:Uncharacterized protein n=1 Tax=Trichinella nelsoni TaxID=6336 RepID=A0A0V0SB59_9BILA|nr:hypothetical protein T07_8040 [Trichinella nelsoni]